MKYWLLLALLLPVSIRMTGQTAECVSLTQQALELSGFNQNIEEEAQTVASDEFVQNLDSKRRMTDETRRAYIATMRKNLDAQMLKKDLLKSMAEGCAPEKMRQTVEQLQTPFIAHMLELEAAIRTPAGKERVKRYADALRVAPPTDERLAAVQALDKSLNITEFRVEALISVVRAMLSGFQAPEDVTGELEAHRREVHDQMQSAVEISLLLTYRGVPRPDLERYAKELGVEPLRGFYRSVERSYIDVMVTRARAVAEDLKASLPPRKS